MSQAEALLASLADVVPEHTHTVTDSDTYFVIDPITRTMENTARRKNVIMQYDHESEVLTFEIPRYVEGHDMSLCNRVYSHWNNIDAKTKEETADVHELTDLRINPDNPDTVICSWLIKRQSTMHAGILSFLIQYKCVDDAGNDIYEWHTDIYDSMEVRKGRRNNQAAIVEYTDILEQWYARLFGGGESIIADIQAATLEAQATLQEESASQQSAIAAKAQEALDSIPPDYTEMYRMAEEAMRTKADAIVVDAEGAVISISNASDDPLQSLRIFGRTTQAGEPSPENPQELVSVENQKIYVCGKNLLDMNDTKLFNLANGQALGISVEHLQNGCTYTATLNGKFTLVKISNHPEGYNSYAIKSEGIDTITFEMGRHSLISNELKQYMYLSIDGEFITDIAQLDGTGFQLELGLEATDYESPYPIQALSINRTIPGVPVNTGGTYTDVNGQEWVADEIVYDYPNGKWQYIQRVNTHELSGVETPNKGSDKWQKEGMFSFYVNVLSPDTVYATDDVGYFEDCLSNQCTPNMWEWTQDKGLNNIAARKSIVYISLDNNLTGILSDDTDEVKLSKAKSYLAEKYASGDPITIQYILATPIIHELTTEEVLAFKALRTNKPNTVIQNGVGAYMIAEYNADTEIFMRENQPGPTDEQINNAVNTYLDTNGVQVPSDDHIRALIDEALGEIVNGEY